MKKTIVLLMTAVFMLSMVACGNNDNENNEVIDSNEQIEQNVEVDQEENKKPVWPENEYTKLVPAPEFAYIASNVSGNTFKASFTGASVQQVRDYAAKVKEAGFSLNEEVKDEESYGMEVYNYKASNADGYSIDIYCGNESISITIQK